MLTLVFICSTIVDFYVSVLLLRAWLWMSEVDRYNPFCQLIIGITQPLVGRLQRLVPAHARIDGAALLLAFFLLTLKVPLLGLLQAKAMPPFPPHLALLVGLLALLKTAGRVLFWVLLMRSLLSWASKGRHPIEYTLQQLTEPLLRRIRFRLPKISGLDFSVMALILLLMILNLSGADLFGQLWATL